MLMYFTKLFTFLLLFTGYAAWQHDRSQDELLLGTQEAQQRDPQGEFMKTKYANEKQKS